MAFESVQIQTTVNGASPIVGYRDDVHQGDVVVASLTSEIGVSSVHWELIGRPELSLAGGTGINPWDLGTGLQSAWTIDSDDAGPPAVHRDGTYVLQATINPGSPGETRKTIIVRRLTGLTIPGPNGTTLPLAKLGPMETYEDTSVPNTREGWATMLNRWLERLRGAGTGGGGTVNTVNAGPGISITGTSTDPIVNNTGVISVTSGTGISITGTGANPVVNNTGILSITAGLNVSITGTIQNPIINAAGSGSGGANPTLFRRTNIAGMAGIDASGFLTSDAHICEVLTVGDFYRYVPGSTMTVSGTSVVTNTGGGGGQWARMGIPNQAFLQATYWSVSPATGNDQNVGWGTSEAAADAHPLQSFQELNRRLVGWNQVNSAAGLTTVSLSIHLMDDLVDPTKFAILTNLASPDANDFIRIRGGTSPVDGSASNRTITAVTPAVPATNTEREIVIAGIGLKPGYVGKMIQTTDGLKTAFITRQKSADHFSISQVIDNASGINGSDTWNVSDFAVNDHVNILDLVKILGWPFPAAGVAYPYAAQLRFDGNVAGFFPQNIISSGFATAAQCIFGTGVLDAFEFGFLLSGAANLSISGCLIWGSNGNVFYGGLITWASVGLIVPGPIFAGGTSMIFLDEVLFVGATGSGAGLRATGDSPLLIEVTDESQIGEFGMNGPTIAMLSTHAGMPGEIFGSDGNDGTKSLWYGSGNIYVNLIIGKGSRSKFPKLGITVTTSGPGFVNLAGIGLSDTSNNYLASQIPIVDLSTLTMLNDSGGASF